MRKISKSNIVVELLTAPKNERSQSELIAHFCDEKGKKQAKQIRALKIYLKELEKSGIILLRKGKYQLSARKSLFEGEVKRVFRAHGFVLDIKTGEEFFVRGRDLLGSVPGDKVVAKLMADDRGGQSRLAKVLAISEEATNVLTGIIVSDNYTLYLLPDSFISEPLPIVSWGDNRLRIGDKVRFTIRTRGTRHSDHVVDIEHVYGNADTARVSVTAYLEEKNIPSSFPNAVIDEAKHIQNKGISPAEIKERIDLRAEPIFTIDGADTKDIDDAISIEKADFGYRLGVHIADVSYYVRRGGELDQEAFTRGTSVYIADLVIPMLPKELSNDICSLNPNEDRLAFSCMMDISESGKLLEFRFAKTVIRSRVQGVYSEINQIIEGKQTNALLDKYKDVIEQVPLMTTLASILQKNRANRGAPPIKTDESKILCDENGKCIDIIKRQGGISENIIEEFMLMANNAAARLAMNELIPFVYRIHEAPTSDKLATLAESLTLLGVDTLGINERSSAADLAAVLTASADTDKESIVNMLVLRTMMKARYSEQPMGHYGLVMEEYAHFTSPIRRYPDLAIHRILSDFLKKRDKAKLRLRYDKFSVSAAARASTTELVAVAAERDCDKFYMAEYMHSHIGEEYDAIISGITPNGIFVKLPNTVEGRIDVTTLPTGEYEVEQQIALVEQLTKTRYVLGDKARIRCEAVNIAAGMVDFVFAEEQQGGQLS